MDTMKTRGAMRLDYVLNFYEPSWVQWGGPILYSLEDTMGIT